MIASISRFSSISTSQRANSTFKRTSLARDSNLGSSWLILSSCSQIWLTRKIEGCFMVFCRIISRLFFTKRLMIWRSQLKRCRIDLATDCSKNLCSGNLKIPCSYTNPILKNSFIFLMLTMQKSCTCLNQSSGLTVSRLKRLSMLHCKKQWQYLMALIRMMLSLVLPCWRFEIARGTERRGLHLLMWSIRRRVVRSWWGLVRDEMRWPRRIRYSCLWSIWRALNSSTFSYTAFSTNSPRRMLQVRSSISTSLIKFIILFILAQPIILLYYFSKVRFKLRPSNKFKTINLISAMMRYDKYS